MVINIHFNFSFHLFEKKATLGSCFLFLVSQHFRVQTRISVALRPLRQRSSHILLPHSTCKAENLRAAGRKEGKRPRVSPDEQQHQGGAARWINFTHRQPCSQVGLSAAAAEEVQVSPTTNCRWTEIKVALRKQQIG